MDDKNEETNYTCNYDKSQCNIISYKCTVLYDIDIQHINH